MIETVSYAQVKILICDSVADELVSGLSGEGYSVTYSPGLTKDDLLRVIGDYNVVVVRSRTKLTSDVLENASNLKIIARAGIGTDNIDEQEADRRGIKVLTAAGASTQSVVELNLGLAIDLARKLSELNRKVRSGEFNKAKGRELSGSVCGIIGFGRIGYETARMLKSLGCDIVAYDIFKNAERMEKVGGKYLELQELLSVSDFVFTTVTLNESSRNLIGKKELSEIKEGVLVINTSRAEAYNGQDLLESLKSGRMGGYAADVMWNEPPREDWEKELLSLENVIITPHIGAQTPSAQKNVALSTLENIRKAVRGEE